MQSQLAPTFRMIAILSLVVACDQSPRPRAGEWPPLLGWAEQNFQKNRASLEALESMLLASKFQEVWGPGVTVGMVLMPDGTKREEILKVNGNWLEHFRKSSVFGVVDKDSYTAYPTGLDPFAPNIVMSSDNYKEVEASDEFKNMLIGTLTYIHKRKTVEEPVVCQASYKIAKCGACVVNLAPDWSAYFTWSAASFTPTRIEASSETTLSQGEIETLSRNAYEQCATEWEALTESDPR